MRAVALAVAWAITAVSAAGAESPKAFVKRFYEAANVREIRGVPQPRFESHYSTLCGIEIIRAVRWANREMEAWCAWADKHRPGENLMKPHLEENLFEGFSDGPTTWKVGSASSLDGRPVVEVAFEHVEQGKFDHGKVYRWTNQVVLDRAGDTWVVRDILYERGGSLLERLTDFARSCQSRFRK